MKHSVICIFNENKKEYNVKTSENDVKYSSFNMGEMDKSRELYYRDNSSRIEGKTVQWEHTIVQNNINKQSFDFYGLEGKALIVNKIFELPFFEVKIMITSGSTFAH